MIHGITRCHMMLGPHASSDRCRELAAAQVGRGQPQPKCAEHFAEWRKANPLAVPMAVETTVWNTL